MKTKWVFLGGLSLFIVGLMIAIAGAEEIGKFIGVFGGMVTVLGFPLAAIVELCIRYKEFEKKRKQKQEEIRRKKDAQITEKQERIAKLEAKRQEQEAKRRSKVTIAEVKYLGSGSQTQSGGGLGGAIVGGLVAGPLGAVVGASATKNGDQKQRFAVKYADGHVIIKEVHPNSWEYKELMKHIKWDDLG